MIQYYDDLPLFNDCVPWYYNWIFSLPLIIILAIVNMYFEKYIKNANDIESNLIIIKNKIDKFSNDSKNSKMIKRGKYYHFELTFIDQETMMVCNDYFHSLFLVNNDDDQNRYQYPYRLPNELVTIILDYIYSPIEIIMFTLSNNQLKKTNPHRMMKLIEFKQNNQRLIVKVYLLLQLVQFIFVCIKFSYIMKEIMDNQDKYIQFSIKNNWNQYQLFGILLICFFFPSKVLIIILTYRKFELMVEKSISNTKYLEHIYQTLKYPMPQWLNVYMSWLKNSDNYNAYDKDTNDDILDTNQGCCAVKFGNNKTQGFTLGRSRFKIFLFWPYLVIIITLPMFVVGICAHVVSLVTISLVIGVWCCWQCQRQEKQDNFKQDKQDAKIIFNFNINVEKKNWVVDGFVFFRVVCLYICCIGFTVWMIRFIYFGGLYLMSGHMFIVAWLRFYLVDACSNFALGPFDQGSIINVLIWLFWWIV